MTELTRPPFGRMLRKWRRARGVSQLELAFAAGVSQRHLSFLETGRSRPSRGTVLRLASVLRVPLDHPVSRAIDELLERQEPYPAIVVDPGYDVLRGNDGLDRLVGFLMGPGAADVTSNGRMNVADLMMRPGGLRAVTENWEEVGTWLILRLQAEAMMEEGRGRVSLLLKRVLAYADVACLEPHSPPDSELLPTLTLRFRRGDIRLSLFSVVATVGTPLDASLEDTRVELFFPADAETRAWFEG